MFCHVIVKNYLCNVSCKFLINIESTWRSEIKEQAPQSTYKKAILKNFAISTGSNLCWSLFLKKLPTFRPATLLKRDPNTGVSLCFPVFLMIILTFMNIWFETSASGGFLIFSIVDCYMDLKVEGLFSLSKG